MEEQLFDVIVFDHRDDTALTVFHPEGTKGFTADQAADELLEFCDDSCSVRSTRTEEGTFILWSVCPEQKQHYSFFARAI